MSANNMLAENASFLLFDTWALYHICSMYIVSVAAQK